MILDIQTLMADQQSLVNAIGTYNSTNVIDLWGQATAPTIPGLGGSVIKDIGRGKRPEILVQVTTAVVAAGGTIQFQLCHCDDAAYTNITMLQETVALSPTVLVAGYQARLAVPQGITRRCLAVRYIIAGGACTIGVFTAGLVWNIQTNSFVGA